MPSGNGVGDDATAMRPASDAGPRREPRFTPGTMLADRYRIVALLGTGGMGEVYRAEDTKLGQQVALKFLPHGVRSDPQRRELLYSEVRLGRQVSHPNVCRLYDVGEWEGNPFLAMEYVDGEDLASLLRRIGKLPPGKAFEIARDICAGIAAAHGLGIVHRDLKPANVMIDGRGHARITDFGLAVVVEDLIGRNEIAGTPAYMAPEQLSGGTVTHKTDLYALGLILYEIFTGKKLLEGKSAADSSSRRSTARSLSSASGEARELDPVIQRVIAQCVEENPDARPSSIHAVIASLPGGDPLQAAIDAGETPSPQMVAAAGQVGDLKTSTTRLALFVFLSGAIGYLFRLDHVGTINVEYDLIQRGVAFALYPAVQAWVLYLALEPYVRRRWPHTLIGWTRLFAGRFRDPMIGRDLLVGMCAGFVTYLLRLLTVHAPTWFGQPALAPLSDWVSPLIATRHLIYAWSRYQVEAVFISLMILLMLLLGLALFRRRWAAILGIWVICTLGLSGAREAPAVQIAFGALMAAVVLIVLIRFGLLALTVTIFLISFLDAAPLTLDPSAWYFGRSLSILILFTAALIYGFWSSLGQKPAFGAPVLEEA